MTARSHIAALGALATVLASSTLSALFSDSGWVPKVIGVVAAVAVGGELGGQLGRRVGAAGLLRAAGGLIAFLFFLCAVFAHPVSPLGFLPTRASFGYMHQDWLTGASDMRDLAPKVPTHLGLSLFVVLGVGAVALAVNLLSSRPALAGLPLLTMFVIPVAISPRGVGVVPFVLGAVGYLVLLAAEGRERAERWGRAIAGRRQPALASGYGQSGRRIGAAAVLLAVVLPLVVPGLHAGRLFQGTAGLNGPSDGAGAVTLNPLATIKGRLTETVRTEYFRYTAPSPQYTRIVVDDTFDGQEFLNSGLNSPTHANDLKISPRGLTDAVDRSAITVQFAMSKLREQYLPVPIPLTGVTGISDKWRFDSRTDTVFAARSDTNGIQYSATAVELKPTPAQLAGAAPVDPNDPYLQRYLQLPTGLNPELAVLAATARTVTAKAATAYDKARTLEKWFSTTGGFVYDEQGPTGLEQNALTEFLQNKHGYCVQFASSMALMARLLGIPSRVDVGFTGGTKVGPSSYVVMSTDSHAWPELYFSGIGWIRFEPTPATGTIGAGTVPTDPVVRPSATVPVPQATDPNVQVPGEIKPESTGGLVSWTLLGQVLVALAVVALALSPAFATRWRRRRAWQRAGDDPVAVAHLAWRDVLVAAGNHGHTFGPGLSVRATAAAIAARISASRIVQQSLQRIASAEEIARYAAVPPGYDGTLHTSSRVVIEALARRSGRWRRLRAVVLPPETLRVWWRATGRVVDAAFGVIDAFSARLTSALRRRAAA